MPAGNKKNQKGFVALMSVILISAVLLVLMVTAAGVAYRSRYIALDYENKRISVALAEACVQTALVRIAQNPAAPAAGDTVTVEPGKTCKICSISNASPYVIQVRSAYGHAYTNLTATSTMVGSDVTVDAWQEDVAGPAGCNL